MKNSIVAIGIVIGALSLPMQARATIVYTENFDDLVFRGSVLNLSGDPVGNVTERWGNDSGYYTINNAKGWTFGPSDTYLAVQNTTGNQGFLLNEPTGVATTVVGLIANEFYNLSFNYSGDNRPGQAYGFRVEANNATVVNYSGLTWNTENPVGHLVTVLVQAGANGAVNLKFSQTSSLQASPIIDDVTLSTVPEPTTMLAGALLLLPFGTSMMRKLRKHNAV